MKKMKKAVSLILAGCLAVSLLTGCGSKTAEATQAPAAKKVMTIGDTTFNSENWEETVDPRSEEHHGNKTTFGAYARHTEKHHISITIIPTLKKSYSHPSTR